MIKTSVGIAALAFACSVTTAANAQLVTTKQLSLPMAVTIATTAVETCKAQGYNVSVHVIGAAGASGAPGGDKDEACVKAGIDKVAGDLK